MPRDVQQHPFHLPGARASALSGPCVAPARLAARVDPEDHEAADPRPGSSRQLCGQASVRPCLGLFSATLTMRSLREAAEDAPTARDVGGHARPLEPASGVPGKSRRRIPLQNCNSRRQPASCRRTDLSWRPGRSAPVPPLGSVLAIGRLPSSGPCEARRSVTAQSPSARLEDPLAPQFASLQLTQGAIACR